MAEKELITVQARQEDILRRAAMLTKNGRIVVTNQEEADFAGETANEGALLQQEWREQPENYGTLAEPGEIPITNKLHDRRIAAWRKLDAPLGFVVTGCRNAANSWRLEEQRKLEEAAQKREAKEHAKGNQEFVLPRKKIEVAGLIPMGDRWKAKVYWCAGKDCVFKCDSNGRARNPGDQEKADNLHYTQGRRLLIREIAKKKELDYLWDPNESGLNELARREQTVGPILPGVVAEKIEGLKRG
jgi:hypothetical protein